MAAEAVEEGRLLLGEAADDADDGWGWLADAVKGTAAQVGSFKRATGRV